MKALFRTGCLVCFLLSTLTRAESDNTIIWAATDLPGVYGLNTQQDPPELEGFVGAVQNYLFDHLEEEFQLQPVAMRVPRIEREMRVRDNVCTGVLLRTTEREQFLRYSQPYIVIPTQQIVMTLSSWEKQGKPEQQNLEELLTLSDLVGLRVNQRSYGRFIDETLNQHEEHTMEVSGSANAIRMLAGERADYLIEYPAIISELLGEQTDQLRFVTIANTEPFINLAISCSQSELGARFIAAVNAQLPDIVRDPTYQALNLEVAPQQLRSQLSNIYLQQVVSAPH